MSEPFEINEPDLQDPALQDFERRLTAFALRPTDAARQRMLYESGWAAGRAHEARRTWQFAAAAAALLALCSAQALYLATAERSDRQSIAGGRPPRSPDPALAELAPSPMLPPLRVHANPAVLSVRTAPEQIEEFASTALLGHRGDAPPEPEAEMLRIGLPLWPDEV